jgi:hypothetical protein
VILPNAIALVTLVAFGFWQVFLGDGALMPARLFKSAVVTGGSYHHSHDHGDDAEEPPPRCHLPSSRVLNGKTPSSGCYESSHTCK